MFKYLLFSQDVLKPKDSFIIMTYLPFCNDKGASDDDQSLERSAEVI